MNNTSENSKILLLCLGTDKVGRKPKDITVTDIHEVFSRFGALARILIFSKSAVFKAFLEFDDFAGSNMVQGTLHNSTLPKLGQVKLYYSAQQRLESSNKYVEFWERNSVRSPSKDDDIFTNSSTSSRQHKDTKPENFFVKQLLSDSNKKRPRVDYAFSTKLSSSPMFDDTKSRSAFTEPKPIVLSKGTEFSRKIEFANTISTMDFTQQLEESNVQVQAQVQAQPQAQMSKVVLVSNLDNLFTSVQELFNLFSCFGDINKLILMHNLQKALVEYQAPESSRLCIEHLSGLSIANTKLKVNYSKYKKIDIKKSFRNEASLQFNEVLTVPSSLNRYGTGVIPQIDEISSKLLFEVEKKDNIKMLDVYFYIEKFAEPQSIKVLDSPDKNKMQLVLSFKDKATAITIMSKFHRSDIKSAKVSISFHS